MPEEQDSQKFKKDYPEIFNKLPPELVDLAFSQTTSLKIANICSENKIEKEEEISKVAYFITHVLFGKLEPKILQLVLERNLSLPSIKAEKIAYEINQSIFSGVKESLAKIYKIEDKPLKNNEDPETNPKITPSKTSNEKKPPPSKEPDTYQEPIEE